MTTYSQYAIKYLGTKQHTKKHKEIIDGYNKIKPLPRGYKATYNDSWCACFVSYVLKQCNASIDIYECSANNMVQKAIKQGVYTNKKDTPKTNDIIFFSWGNNGIANHVGFVYKIEGNYLVTIEGNKSHKVDTRRILKTSKFIKGYARIPQKSNTKLTNKVTTNKTNSKVTKTITTKIVNDVINGKYGNGKERKEKLEKLGYNYNEVQREVNKKLK